MKVKSNKPTYRWHLNGKMVTLNKSATGHYDTGGDIEWKRFWLFGDAIAFVEKQTGVNYPF